MRSAFVSMTILSGSSQVASDENIIGTLPVTHGNSNNRCESADNLGIAASLVVNHNDTEVGSEPSASIVQATNGNVQSTLLTAIVSASAPPSSSLTTKKTYGECKRSNLQYNVLRERFNACFPGWVGNDTMLDEFVVEDA